MPQDMQTLLMYLIGGAAFVLLMSVYLIGIVLWSRRQQAHAQRIGERLGLVEGQSGPGRVLRLWHDGQEATTTVYGSIGRRSLMARLEIACREAGWESPPQTYLLGVTGAASLAFLVGFALTSNLLIGGCAAVGVILCFWFYLKVRINRQKTLFENQLIDALELAARSLRVGHPLVSAFRLVSEEVPAPVGPLFGTIVQQQTLGRGLDEAIRKAAEASTSDDMRLFATSVVIQIRSGGNLADMMERVALVMRDRLRLTRRVRVLTAQTQFSKQVLLAMPVVVFLLLNFINPEYMKPLYYTAEGQHIMVMAACMLMFGAYLMNRLAIIRY